MREMKDSGNEWYGAIPTTWELNKIKFITTVRSESGKYKANEDRYIGLENVNGYSNEVIETDTEYDTSIQSICKKGDVLFSKLRPYLAKVIIVKENAFCTGEFINFSSFCGDKKYLFYAILNPKFIENINASTYGAKMPRANPQYILDQQICFPPIDEQQRIAEFLDRECGKIDGLKADIQVQIDTLEQYKRSVITEAVTHGLNPSVPMKDSKVCYGQIPSEWKELKGKYVFKQRNDRGNNVCLQLLSPSQKYGVIPQDKYEELTGMNAVKLNDSTNYALLKTIHKGDYCISLRSFQGGFEYSEYEGVVSPAYQVFYPIITIADGYYKYLFKEKGFIDVMNSYTMSLRDGKNIAFDDFGDTFIPVPPLDEQQEIADYLDNKCAEIEQIIADKKSQIETLDGYKKSLIYEYVTGKKEVI